MELFRKIIKGWVLSIPLQTTDEIVVCTSKLPSYRNQSIDCPANQLTGFYIIAPFLAYIPILYFTKRQKIWRIKWEHWPEIILQ